MSESEVIKAEKELRLAMLANDVQKLDELIYDSLVFVTPDGNIATKQMDLDAHKSKIQKMTELIPFEQQISFHDDFATVSVKMKIVGTYGELDISGDYRYLRVWKKIGNVWKIIAGSVVKI